MANKNIQMKHKNGTDWDNMYPITLINNIFDTDGNNLKAYIANKINYIDIRDYGAKGDGLTDDSAALVSAINELNAKGGILRIPKGTFRIGMNIVPNIIRSGCYIEGDGEGSSVLLMTDYYVSHNFLQFGDDTKDTVRDVGIRKLTIQYNTQTAGCAVKFTNVQKFFVKDAEVNSAYNAFDIGSTANENSNFCYMENVIGGVSHCAFNIIGGCNGFHLVNIQFNSEFSNVGAIGMQLPLSGNLDTMYIDNCLFQRFHYGIMANGTSGTLQNFFFTNLV
jgi:hypothetical protein